METRTSTEKGWRATLEVVGVALDYGKAVRQVGRNKYPEETVAKILDTALALFCSKGYDATTIQDIVDGLDGMTKGAIYHHFKSKEEIFDAAFERAMAPVAKRRRAAFERDDLTGAQKLKALYAAESVVPQAELWARIRPAADPVKSERLLALQYQGTFDESVEQYLLPVIEEGIADGSIVCDCPREAAEAVSLLANLWLLPLFRPLEPKEQMLSRARCLARMAAAVGLDLGDEVLETTAQVWQTWARSGC